MAHAQKPDIVFPRNGRVHLNRWGRQFIRLLAAEVCASAWVMLDRPRSEVAWEYWLPPSFASFPFTAPPVRHRVPSGSERALHVNVYILEPTQFINFKFLVPKSGILLRFNLSGVLCGRDQVWAHSVAFNTTQITLLKVFKLAGAKTVNVLSVKLYIHRLTTVLTLPNCPVAGIQVCAAERRVGQRRTAYTTAVP